MNQTEGKIVKLAYVSGFVKKTKKPNAKCLKCGKRIYSYAVSCGFQGVECEECSK
jgi:hypothetical protein